jgi:hypothetical protein
MGLVKQKGKLQCYMKMGMRDPSYLVNSVMVEVIEFQSMKKAFSETTRSTSIGTCVLLVREGK